MKKLRNQLLRQSQGKIYFSPQKQFKSMPSQTSQQQWGLVYYRKKAQFNQYIQFKTKSFQYQKILSKLHFTSIDDKQKQQKQVKLNIQNLNSTMQEMRNIFSQIHQEMKFLKLENLASLIQGVEQLVTSIHHYTIEDFKNKLQYGQIDRQKNQDIDSNTCKKCLGSINQLNLKKLYDQITTTESSVEDDTLKMTKQDRKKLISQLDEYDILLAEKDNYLRKVNDLLQSKGKVGQLSSHDKTYNFLSQYLSKIQKIQQRKHKSYNKTDPNTQAEDRKWEQESYKHILQYIKRVLFEHFVNECSGPVKKMFEKINIDKLFKSFNDHENEQKTWKSQATMQNHQTQTANIPEVQQLKMVERKLQFKVKEISMLKSNKDDLQKKYLSTLDLNRKVESEMFEVKKHKKWYESEMKIAQQNLKNLNEKYQQAVRNYEEDQRRTIQRYINQRQRLSMASKIMESDFMTLEEQHKKCLRMRNVAKQYMSSQTQTSLQQFPDQKYQEQFSDTRNNPSPLKRRKSKMNKMLFTSMNGEKKNGMIVKDLEKGINLFDSYQNDTISEKDQKQSKIGTRFQIQSHVLDLIIRPQYEEQIKEYSSIEVKKGKLKQHKSMTRLIKQKQFLRQNERNLQTQRILTEGDEIKQVQFSGNKKRIKMGMKSFKGQRSNQQLQQVNNINFNQRLSPYKFSNFNNRFTQNGQMVKSKNMVQNMTSPDLYTQIVRRQTEVNQNQSDIGHMVSDRLYSQRKRKQSKQLPFERVIQNGKERFYIKKISRQSINYKTQKEKMKQISQILKPYVYNNNTILPSPPKKPQPKVNHTTIRQRMSLLGHKRLPTDEKNDRSQQKQQCPNQKQQKQQQKTIQVTNYPVNNIGQDILSVKHIIESQYAYLKAVGFIDFLMKIGKENKKMVKTINKIQNQVKQNFKSPVQKDLQLFGGLQQAQDYVRGRNFWTLDDVKENIMIYNKNDGLSIKVQKYFTLLKRANPQLFNVLIRFLIDPIFAVYGKKTPNQQIRFHRPQDSNFVRDLFNQLQKYHKIKHNQCRHIYDFLQKIGFYKYTYF